MIVFTFFKVFLSDFACLNAEFYVTLSPNWSTMKTTGFISSLRIVIIKYNPIISHLKWHR